jgi:hypothetical protein
MKREHFIKHGSQGLALFVETTRDWNGRFYICYRPHTSLLLDNRKAVLKWAGYPAQTPTRADLDAWLQAVESADTERQEAKAPAATGPSPEVLATGFGPEAHGLDDTDPNHNTRTII